MDVLYVALPRQPAPVHGQDVPRDEAGSLRGQEDGRALELLGQADSPERHAVVNVVPERFPPQGGVRGGDDVARGMLEQALGEEAATKMWEEMGRGKRKGFALLDRSDASQVAPFIAKQHPQTIAFILTQLRAEKAAAKAKLWIWIAFGLGIACWALWFIFLYVIPALYAL